MSGGRLTLALLAAEILRLTAANDGCGERLFSHECTSFHTDCYFCCGNEFGRQCLNRSVSHGEFQCNAASRIGQENAKMTCGDLCAVAGGNCTSCVERIWCFFCESSKTCIAPYEHCHDSLVVESCTPASAVPLGNGWAMYVIYAAAALAAVMIVALVIFLCRRYRVGADRMTEARPLLTEGDLHATVDRLPRSAEISQNPPPSNVVPPTLNTETTDTRNSDTDPRHHVGPEESDDDREESSSSQRVGLSGPTEEHLCQLCFDEPNCILFLPCHHRQCCEACANKIRPNRRRNELSCPFCRRQVAAMVRLTGIRYRRVELNLLRGVHQ